jgi:eukaryotic-like serine/threonine-protein kinase
MIDVLAKLSAALAGRYVIERELGAGGMATVYLAHDVRHDRKVALKVLRPELAAILGGERFLKEIRLTANLQHPHILPLHDSGEADGTVFYVMPYVEGESLRDRLNREKQLPVDDAVRIAREVASALDYAHRHDVVHRDIKPENILLHDGQALVADFGIALAVSTVGGSTRMTETGMSLGTPHYMAPEQAMGDREITPRADVYALGVVLYEMLTGDPPFTGSTAQAIVARVVTEAPRGLTLQRHTIPPHVEAVVLKALEKLPADRFATAAEFAAALGNPQFTVQAAAPPAGTVAAAPRRAPWRSPWTLAPAALAAAALGLAAWLVLRPAPEPPVTRYGLLLPESQAPRPNLPFRISPDGRYFAYVGPGENNTMQLWVKDRGRFEATALAGTNGILNFTFSPDGQWLAYTQAGELRKMPITGGAATTLADSASSQPGVAWLDDGTIVFVQVSSRILRRVPEVGGPATVLYRPDSGDAASQAIAGAVQPAPLPGSRGLLYVYCVATNCANRQELRVLDLRTGTSTTLQPGVVRAEYVPTGHIIYVRRDGGMFALPFDPRALRATGAPVPVMDSVAVLNNMQPLMSVSPSGTLVMRPGSAVTSRVWWEMVWIDPTGRETVVDSSWTFRHTGAGGNVGWSLSPDGRRLLVGMATDAGDDIWVKELPRGPLSRVTFDSMPEYRPRWAPDGRHFLYGAFGSGNVMRARADGTGTPETLLDLPVGVYEFILSRDERRLLFRSGGTVGLVGARDISYVELGVDSQPRPLVASPAFDEAAFALSPDGRWLAYESNETGRTEIYVRPFPNADSTKWQVSTSGGRMPVWARSGRELYFVSAAREMIAVGVTAAPAFRVEGRRALFRLRDDIYVPEGENYTPFDVAPDGRFIMARRVRAEAGSVAPLIVVDNWFTELRRALGDRR